jgi:hypothetical protein
MEHETLFDQYVFPLMCDGVQEQITDAYEDGDASARLMAAVALMAYTEFMGRVKEQKFSRRGNPAMFRSFLTYMGPQYEELQGRMDVYEVFRNGLVHLFFVKGKCTVAMKNSPGPLIVLGTPPCKDKEIMKPVDSGIGLEDNGGYFLVIEKYFTDFKAACLRLHQERRGQGLTYNLDEAGGSQGTPPMSGSQVSNGLAPIAFGSSKPDYEVGDT